MEVTISTIGPPANAPEADINKLVLKQIFAESMMKPMKRNSLKREGLLILPAYWSKEPEPIDEDSFVASFCEDQKVHESEDEARQLC